MGARVLNVYDSPEDIIHDRPKKPVRGRAARLAAYRAQREKEAPTEEPVRFPLTTNEGAGGATPAPSRDSAALVEAPVETVAKPGPIVWAYEPIPYSWEQVQAHK